MTSIRLQTATFPPVPPPQPVEPGVSSVVMKALGNITLGAAVGYTTYWMQRGMIFIGLMEVNAPLSPIPHVLVGLAGEAIAESAKLAHFTALKILGDRELYENNSPNSFGGQLRNRAWKVISCVESLEHKVDSFFSHLFGIRTRREVEAEGISITNPAALEVLRREFWREAASSLRTAVPQELGIVAVESLGYKVLGGHALIFIHALMFMTNLHTRVAAIYQLQAQALANLEYDRHNNLAENSLATEQIEDVDGFVIIDPTETERENIRIAERPAQINIQDDLNPIGVDLFANNLLTVE